MKAQQFYPFILSLAVLMALTSMARVLASAAYPTPASDAIQGESNEPGPVSAPARPESIQAGQAIIIDHTCTDLSKIPDYWIGQARQLVFHFAHTSHGSQINTGVEWLETQNPKYKAAIYESGPVGLPGETDALRIYDGNNVPDTTYITPELYWSEPDGINNTKSVADTGWFDFSMWSWCGQQSSNSEATVQQYLDTLSQLEAQYPDMRFIYMTGHTDGGSTTLARNNNIVRQYVRDHAKVLFDFADIESYDPDGGGPYTNNSEGTCSWCVTWCNSHPEECTNLPDSCAHTEDQPEDTLFCKLKGQAFWWMMARLAGWDGTPQTATSFKAASTGGAEYGQTVTYTIVVRNLDAPLGATVYLTDTVPEGLAYVPGTLTATTGIVTSTLAPTLTWSGVFSPATATTLTYAVTVTVPEDTIRVITNTAVIVAPGYSPIARTATVVVNGYTIFLPVVAKQN